MWNSQHSKKVKRKKAAILTLVWRGLNTPVRIPAIVGQNEKQFLYSQLGVWLQFFSGQLKNGIKTLCLFTVDTLLPLALVLSIVFD